MAPMNTLIPLRNYQRFGRLARSEAERTSSQRSDRISGKSMWVFGSLINLGALQRTRLYDCAKSDASSTCQDKSSHN